MVIPLRANAQPVEIMAPLVEVPSEGMFVLSTDEIFAIDTARLKPPVGKLGIGDRAKIKPALDKVIGEYCHPDPMPQAMKAHLVQAILDALMGIPESGLPHRGQSGCRRRGNPRKASHANPSP